MGSLFNRDADKVRNEQKDEQRRLEKREDLLEQSSQNFLQKEKNLQQNEKKLTDLAAVADYVWAIGHQKPHGTRAGAPAKGGR